MQRKADLRTDSTEVDWADDGLAIGSPNDPAIGEAYNQTTGPGGKGLTAPKKHADEASDVAAERANHFRNG
jgi:hypothetical protein